MKSWLGVPSCSMILFHWSMWSVPGKRTPPLMMIIIIIVIIIIITVIVIAIVT